MERLRATLAVVALSSLLSGCALLELLGAPVPIEPAPTAPPAGMAITATCDELTAAPAEGTSEHVLRSVAYVKVGEPFTVTLCSNATTGFEWEEPVLSGEASLQVLDHAFTAPDSDLAGAAGTETWTLVAGDPGAGKASFAYSRPWEGGEKGVWVFELGVGAS
jgi:predicted secreted protein